RRRPPRFRATGWRRRGPRSEGPADPPEHLEGLAREDEAAAVAVEVRLVRDVLEVQIEREAPAPVEDRRVHDDIVRQGDCVGEVRGTLAHVAEAGAGAEPLQGSAGEGPRRPQTAAVLRGVGKLVAYREGRIVG